MREGMREALQWKLKMLGEDPSYLDKVICSNPNFNTGFYWESTPPGPSFWGGLEREWNEAKFSTEVMQEQLLKYCHDEGCKDFTECPEKHIVCSNYLGLNTAIAWIAATVVNTESVDTCMAIAALHSRKYPLLNVMLEKLVASLERKGVNDDEL